jgi:hypothetical protein
LRHGTRARYDRPHVDHRRKPFFGLRASATPTFALINEARGAMFSARR